MFWGEGDSTPGTGWRFGKATIEDELNGTEPLSQFGRALEELGIQLIHAHTPQAKGRVERLFNTLQDRLMRLRDIRSISEANAFLKEYLPIYNRRFAKKATQAGNLNRPIPKGVALHRILCIKIERTVRNDCTIAHDRKRYQIEEAVKTNKVMVEEYTNGSMAIWCQGQKVMFREIAIRPAQPPKLLPRPRQRKTATPAKNHPWRGLFFVPKKMKIKAA